MKTSLPWSDAARAAASGVGIQVTAVPSLLSTSAEGTAPAVVEQVPVEQVAFVEEAALAGGLAGRLVDRLAAQTGDVPRSKPPSDNTASNWRIALVVIVNISIRFRPRRGERDDEKASRAPKVARRRRSKPQLAWRQEVGDLRLTVASGEL